MKRFAWIVAIAFATPALASAGATCQQRSQELVSALKSGRYAAATEHFDATVKAAVPAGKLKQIWEGMLPLQAGAYDAKAAGQVPRIDASGAVVTPLHFAQAWLELKVTCNADMTISAFRFLPGKAPDGEAAARRTISGSWGVSKPTQVMSPLGPLPATLTLPEGKGPFPGVVLVGGSGSHDRDESVGPNKPFRDIARGLAAHGVASLRYDKRTFAYAAKILTDKHLRIDDEVTDDALTAAHMLAGTAGIDAHRVFVLGHSLGAMLAPRIGQRDPALAGLIMLAAPARPLLAVSAQQVREQDKQAGVTEQQIAAGEKAIADERKLLEHADPKHPPAGTFASVPQSYWMSLHDYDQVKVAKNLSMPMLFMQGGSDFQVSPKADYARWKRILAGHAGVSFHLYPGLSHLFMPAGKTRTIADYKAPGHVDPRVIDDIAAWIKAQR